MTVLDPTGDVDLVAENAELRRQVEHLKAMLQGIVDIGLICLASAASAQPSPPSPDER